MEQVGEHGGSGLVHRRADRHLGGFQIRPPRFTATGEQDAQQLRYFAGDFLLDRFRRFFSCGENASSTGRARQIRSLTSSSS